MSILLQINNQDQPFENKRDGRLKRTMNYNVYIVVLFLMLCKPLLLFSQPPNMGFESGNISGWNMCGHTTNANPAPRYTITSGAGNDPFCPIPVVCPWGGTRSLKLGDTYCGLFNNSDDEMGNGCTGSCQTGSCSSSLRVNQKVTRTFTVDPNFPIFQLNYAPVIRYEGHAAIDRAYVRVTVTPVGGACMNFTHYDGDGDLITAPTNGSGCNGDSKPVTYRPWAAKYLDLSANAGTNVTITVEAMYCAPNVHWAYVYLDCALLPKTINQTGDICSGSATLNAPELYGVNYNWSGPGIVSGQGTNSIDVNISGVYTLTYTTPDGCLNSTSSYTATVTELPVLTINNPSAVCSPSTVDLTNSAITTTTSGALTYFTDAGFTTPVVDPTAVGAGTYYIVATNGACTDDASVTVTITETPVLTVNNPQAVCSPSTVDLTNSTITNTTSGTLTYFTDAGFTNPITDPTTVGAGTYFVAATNGMCTDDGLVTVTVIESPILTLNNPSAICPSATVDLTNPAIANTTVGTLSYYTDAGFTTPVADPTAVGTGTYFVTATNGSCTDSGSLTVTAIASPIIDSIGSVVACDSYTLPAITGTNTNNPVYWTGSNQTGTQVAVGTVITQNTTLYMFDETSDCSDEEQLVITINPLPAVASVVGGNNYCDGDPVSNILVTTTGTGNVTITYTLNGVVQSPVTGASPISLGNVSGVYVITNVTDQNCTSTANGTQTIIINPIPAVPVAGEDSEYCSTVPKQDMTAVASSGGTLTWYTDASLTTVFATGSSATPVNTIGTTTYYVTETSNGCTSPVATVIITINKCDIIIPTGFTPDGDGTNDTWQIVDLDEAFPNAIVRIYNRWGNLIFEHQSNETNPYNANAWDGSYQGNELPVSSFYYVIEFNDAENTKASTGSVSIIKN